MSKYNLSQLKIGDEVILMYGGREYRHIIIHTPELNQLSHYTKWERINSQFADTGEGWYQLEQYEIVSIKTNNKKSKFMSLKSLYKSAFRKEPERSFHKAGIIDDNNDLTSEGRDVFLNYLLEKNKDDFNKEVVQPILEEDKSNN